MYRPVGGFRVFACLAGSNACQGIQVGLSSFTHFPSNMPGVVTTGRVIQHRKIVSSYAYRYGVLDGVAEVGLGWWFRWERLEVGV